MMNKTCENCFYYIKYKNKARAVCYLISQRAPVHTGTMFRDDPYDLSLRDGSALPASRVCENYTKDAPF